MTSGTPGVGNIVIEDGTGYDNSDSIASVTFADTFLLITDPSSMWHNVSTTDVMKGSALRKATMEWMEGQYQDSLRGRISVLDQFLSMPRIGLFDDSGRTVGSAEIPVKMQQAIAMIAHDIVINSTTVLPTGVQRSSSITEETSKIGPMSKTTRWNNQGSDTESSLVAYLAAEALFYPYIDNDGLNTVVLS